MKIALHPQASENYNRKAMDLLQQMEKVDNPGSSNSDAFQPDIHIADVVDSDTIIGDIHQGETINVRTGEVEDLLIRTSPKDALKLQKEACLELRKLAEAIAITKTLRDLASEETIRFHLIDWLKRSAILGVKVDFMEHLLPVLNDSIKKLEVWVPINRLYLESPLKFGRVCFKTIEKEMLSVWIERCLEAVEADKCSRIEDKRREMEFYLKKKLLPQQGLAAATIQLTAEPNRAKEIALEEASRATSLLRVFCAENLDPRATSVCEVLGREFEPTFYLWLFGEEDLPIGAREGYLGSTAVPWELSNEEREKLRVLGFDELVDILRSDKRSDYEETLLESLLIYSKSSIARDPAEKLMFIFTSLETMLLKDGSESIQQNAGERFAFLVGKDSGSRRQALREYKNCYSLRSKFVHHGQGIEDIESVAEFMVNVQFLIKRFLELRSRIRTKKDLIEKIEERKFA